MGMNKGPRARESRRTGMDLSPFGVRPLSTKCKHESRPGQPGKRRPSSSRYGEQLNTKNAIRGYYYVKEKQFRTYVERSKKAAGSTDQVLVALLESRLDSVVYAMGFAITKREARQLVSHAHVEVNGKVVNCPGYAVKPGDKISIKESARKHDRIQSSIQFARENRQYDWIECDYDSVSGVYKEHPSVEQINLFDSHMLGMVIVYYSK